MTRKKTDEIGEADAAAPEADAVAKSADAVAPEADAAEAAVETLHTVIDGLYRVLADRLSLLASVPERDKAVRMLGRSYRAWRRTGEADATDPLEPAPGGEEEDEDETVPA